MATSYATGPVITGHEVQKSWGNTAVHHGLTFRVDHGITALLGANGAGKTTLIGMILGLHRPDSGTLSVLGLDPATAGPEIRASIGYSPEHHTLPPDVRAHDLVRHIAELHGLPTRDATNRASDALWAVGLGEERFRPIGTMSTGQRQRVKLAQALVHDPELLFLDEPTNGLEPKAREDMLELVRELPKRRGCAIVLSTHLLPDVERVCDHAVIMDKGRVRFTGTLEELRAREAAVVHELAIEVRGDAAKLAEALGVAGATCVVISPIALHADLDTRPGDADATTRIFATARACGVQIRGIAARRETVEAAVLRVLAGP